ncbi:MAG TPA: hypothetical protein VFL27_03385 [Candidatus Dormibacteraeota bacterium]|nr:hypothetical protein [Candidatus Dormibacteraeota bacterium]
MSPVTYDQLRVLYRTLLLFATVGTVILAIGLIEFVYFEPPGQASGIKAHIVGVYVYDPATNQTVGPDRSEFPRSGVFAAVVDWSSLPDSLVVDARWYDSFGTMEGRAGPGSPSQLASHTIIPVEVPPGFRYVLPGRYTFVVERLKAGLPVEVLARRFIVVDRT